MDFQVDNLKIAGWNLKTHKKENVTVNVVRSSLIGSDPSSVKIGVKTGGYEVTKEDEEEISVEFTC